MLNLSEEQIRKCAADVRRRLKLENVSAPCMYSVLEDLQHIAKAFKFRPALAAEMGSDEAFMDDETHTLSARESVLEDAKAGRPRARFTIAHELGHYFLGHKGRSRRNPDKYVYTNARLRIEENEANLFASHFLIPDSLAHRGESPHDLAATFQVSLEMAEIAFDRIQKTRRIASGQKRRPPGVVIDFLKEAQKAGYKVKSDISDL